MRPLHGQLILLISLSILVSIAGATYLNVEGPVATQLYDNGSVYLGKIGPGQSFYVLASPATLNQSGVMENQGWNKLEAVELPIGWSNQSSLLFSDPMKMKITAAPDAQNASYKMVLRAVNVYSKLSNLTFNAYINVTLNVFNSSVSQTNLSAGVGEPVNIWVTINNTGVSDDPFVLNAAGGLPAWSAATSVIAAHGVVSKYPYPVFVNTPGVYNFNFTVNSSSSPLVHKTFPITLTVQSSLLNDYKATGEGVVLSPIIYEPVYAFMLFLNDVYHWIFK